jgi:hypothetical protein
MSQTFQNYTEIMKKNNGEDPNFFPINKSNTSNDQILLTVYLGGGEGPL